MGRDASAFLCLAASSGLPHLEGHRSSGELAGVQAFGLSYWRHQFVRVQQVSFFLGRLHVFFMYVFVIHMCGAKRKKSDMGSCAQNSGSEYLSYKRLRVCLGHPKCTCRESLTLKLGVLCVT